VTVGEGRPNPAALVSSRLQAHHHEESTMKKAERAGLLAAALCAAAVTAWSGALGQSKVGLSAGQVAAARTGSAEPNRDADREAIRKADDAFAAAFEKGDVKAVAAMWSDGAEYVGEDGTRLTGRAEIEKAFAEVVKGGPPAKVEVDVRSIRFPSRDTAVEEGFLRHRPAGPTLPSSTRYQTVLVREDGKWLIAYSREWAPEDRLGDLSFLLGKWAGGPKGEEVSVTFTKDSDGPFIIGKFARQANGKPSIAGFMRIGRDEERKQLRSWHFDADGGHGQCLWLRDGDKWVLDAIGSTGAGVATAAVNMLSRLGPDEITWRSIDRMIGGKPLPDTMPIKLTRVKEAR
jgi:uncharacterized protein (TIGR02246 family)